MYPECKQYLIQRLKAAGIKSNPYTSLKKLQLSKESHIGAVLLQNESIVRNGSKTIFIDAEGARHKRRKLFDRQLSFNVVIGDYTDEAVEAILERFLQSCDTGFYADGNYVSVTPVGVDWVEEDDSILKAQIAAEINVTFDGGVYRDTGFAPVNELEIEAVTNGKEPANGN